MVSTNNMNEKISFGDDGMNFYLPATSIRVWLHTNAQINDLIFESIISNIKYYIDKSGDEITQRLLELDEEWDTERVLETSASGLVITGAILALTSKNKLWALLSAVTGGFLLQHALQGWCPPLPFIRRLGVRTQTEIMAEKTLLEVLKEDPQKLDEERIREIVRNII